MSSEPNEVEDPLPSMILAEVQQRSNGVATTSIQHYGSDNIEAQIQNVQKIALASAREATKPTIHIVAFGCESRRVSLASNHRIDYLRRAQELLELPCWNFSDTTVELYHYPPVTDTKYRLSDVPQDHYKYGLHCGDKFTQWLYYPSSHTTIALLPLWGRPGVEWIQEVMQTTRLMPSDLRHPHAMGLWLCSERLFDLREIGLRESYDIDQVQRQMGWHNFWGYGEATVDEEHIDYAVTISKVVTSATSLARSKTIAAGLFRMVAYMLEENASLSSQIEPFNCCDSMIVLCYGRQLRNLSNGAKGIEQRCDEFLTIASTVMQGLINIIARNDQKITIELAKDSRDIAEVSQRVATATKRDSTSMKSIAAVTMVFLPGTFTASLFATPFLNNSGFLNSAHSLWVYWVITIPLTTFTIIAWLLWVGYMDRVEARQPANLSASRSPSERPSSRVSRRTSLEDDRSQPSIALTPSVHRAPSYEESLMSPGASTRRSHRSPSRSGLNIANDIKLDRLAHARPSSLSA